MAADRLAAVQSLAEGRIAALQQTEKHSRTAGTLRILSLFALRYIP
jgi:hypothetical protein